LTADLCSTGEKERERESTELLIKTTQPRLSPLDSPLVMTRPTEIIPDPHEKVSGHFSRPGHTLPFKNALSDVMYFLTLDKIKYTLRVSSQTFSKVWRPFLEYYDSLQEPLDID